MQEDNITRKTISYNVKLFLQVNYLQMLSTFNKTLIFKQKQSKLQSQQTHITQYVSIHKHTIWIQQETNKSNEPPTVITPPPQFWSNVYFDTKIKAMFYRPTQIFEAAFAQYLKQQKYLKELKEKLHEELKNIWK